MHPYIIEPFKIKKRKSDFFRFFAPKNTVKFNLLMLF